MRLVLAFLVFAVALSCGPQTRAQNAQPVIPLCGGSPCSTSTNPTYVVGFGAGPINDTPTVQNASYVSGNCIGGFRSVTIARTNGGSVILNEFKLSSAGGSTPSVTVYLFAANPSSSTCTDKGTFTLSSADLGKLVVAPFSLTLAAPIGTSSTFAEQTNMARIFYAGGTPNSGVQTMFYALVSASTFTPASTTDLQTSFQVRQD